MLSRLVDFILGIPQLCKRLAHCIQGSPLVVVFATLIVVLLVFLIAFFNVCMAKLFTLPGAVVLNLCLIWGLLRLVVRALVFPGSMVCWKRNTEASYRVEMSKQFASHLTALRFFVSQAARRSGVEDSGVTMEPIMLGCMVIEGLARNFRMQQRDQVRFTTEQAHVKLLVLSVESWLSEAKVVEQRSKAGSMELPLLDWLHRIAESPVPVPLSFAVASAPLDSKSETEAGPTLERLEQLISLFDGLQAPLPNFCSNARRFLRAPTVGSLDQLRAELAIRYSGSHVWVRTPSGRKIDAMFISPPGVEGGLSADVDEGSSELTGRSRSSSSKSKEEVPLKALSSDSNSSAAYGPVILWCNPNAAYYETMAYESHWLDFYLKQGCSVLLFNYSGFGRSQGSPTPKSLASDGSSVIEFLKRRGYTNIGVHGRSIGGIVACHVAQAHPDVVKLLVADRTFSTLADAARYTFGNWAVKGLGLAATWANNFANFDAARCYKVMLCDPKDATIPDLAALRTSVALKALERVAANDQLVMEEERLQRVADAWLFLETLIGVCDPSSQCGCNSQACSQKRPARQPVVGKPAADLEASRGGGDVEDDTQQLVGSGRNRGDSRKGVMNAKWLEENADLVHSLMVSYVDNVRYALDIAGGSGLNASGVTLDDLLGRGQLAVDDPVNGLRCFLANIQVWGSLGNLREPLAPGADKDLELFLRKGVEPRDMPQAAMRLRRLEASLTPEKLSSYHRDLSRSMVEEVRRSFRLKVSTIRRSVEPLARDGSSGVSAQLGSLILNHLREIEGFITAIYRFFKYMDMANGVAGLDGNMDGTVNSSDESEKGRDGAASKPHRPALDRLATGYMMPIECGHNGVLSEGELQTLALHLRDAQFGKYAPAGSGGGSTDHV
eukprot:TRINITY_DN46298_c0_g1_i2.p1 TRINITY_DN46298_c0_g1~~TRINITY_DN46298_c0_g1_i2.p1  ORF type:complete len:896 (+),score=215.13 TRINITY_DN46298_c0_g1_i2:114-2801(+)